MISDMSKASVSNICSHIPKAQGEYLHPSSIKRSGVGPFSPLQQPYGLKSQPNDIRRLMKEGLLTRGCGLAVFQTFGGLGLTDVLRQLIGEKFALPRHLCTLSAAAIAEIAFVPLAHVQTRLQLDICHTRQWQSPLHCLCQLSNAAKVQSSGLGIANVAAVSRVIFRGTISSVFIGTIQKGYFFRLYDNHFRNRESIGIVNSVSSAWAGNSYLNVRWGTDLRVAH